MGRKIPGPGQLAAFPAVRPEVVQPPSRLGGLVQDRLAEMAEMVIERRGIQVIDLIAGPLGEGVALRVRIPAASGQRISGP